VQQVARAAGVADAAGEAESAGGQTMIDAFRAAALAVGQRAGLVWAGDLAVALSVLDVGRGGRALTDSPLALALVGWSVSEDHLKLREKLGVSLKGSATR